MEPVRLPVLSTCCHAILTIMESTLLESISPINLFFRTPLLVTVFDHSDGKVANTEVYLFSLCVCACVCICVPVYLGMCETQSEGHRLTMSAIHLVF